MDKSKNSSDIAVVIKIMYLSNIDRLKDNIISLSLSASYLISKYLEHSHCTWMKSEVNEPLLLTIKLTLLGGTPAFNAVARATSSNRTVVASMPTLISSVAPPSSVGLDGHVSGMSYIEMINGVREEESSRGIGRQGNGCGIHSRVGCNSFEFCLDSRNLLF